MNKQPCKKHRYGEPDQQGYVTCWDCGDTFNLAEENDEDEEYERNYVDYGDDDEDLFFDESELRGGDDDDEEFDRCSSCDGHDACADFGCAFDAGLGHLVDPGL